MTLNKDKAGIIRSDVEIGTWGGLGWRDLGGCKFGYEYFLITSDGSNGKVIQHIFENCLEFYMKWWVNYVNSIR